MTKIAQLDWSNLKPDVPEKSTHIVKTKELPKGYRKYPTQPKKKKPKKVKAIDKSIWTDNYNNLEHLRSISREI